MNKDTDYLPPNVVRNQRSIGLELDKMVANKTEWQIGIEQQLSYPSDANALLSSQVNELRSELYSQRQDNSEVSRKHIDSCIEESLQLNCRPGGFIWNVLKR